ncbi:MAG: hypothetical protein NVSMB68_13620 [Thermoanaerobaculia bacterium]
MRTDRRFDRVIQFLEPFVEQLVEVAELREVGRRELENVRDIATARGLDHERTVPIDHGQIARRIAQCLLDDGLAEPLGEMFARLAEDQRRDIDRANEIGGFCTVDPLENIDDIILHAANLVGKLRRRLQDPHDVVTTEN